MMTTMTLPDGPVVSQSMSTLNETQVNLKTDNQMKGKQDQAAKKWAAFLSEKNGNHYLRWLSSSKYNRCMIFP